MRDVEARLKISAIDRTGRVLANIGNKLDAVNKKATLVNRTNAAMLATMARFAAPAFVGYEATRALTSAVKSAGDFEESLFNIQKKLGASKEEMVGIGKEVQQLATSGEVVSTMDEVAAAYERGAAAGIARDQLRDFAKLSVQVADAWEVSAEDAGNFFAGFNKGLGISMKDMPAFASLINDLADSGISDEKDIADFIDRAGASLKNFGLSADQIAAYGASLLNLKMPSEVAARAMDTISGKLMAPANLSPKARTALTKIVGDLKSFSKLAGDQKMMFFLKRLDKLSEQQRTELLGGLLGDGFDDEMTRLVSGLPELLRNLEMVEKHTKTPSNSIAGISQQRLELFNSRLKILQTQLGAIETQLGERILPYAEQAVKSLGKYLTDSDAFEAGKEKLGFSKDRDLYWNTVKDFRKRWKEANPSKSPADADAAEQAAIRALGNGDIKSLDEFVDFDRFKREAAQRGQYRPGRGPNILGAGQRTGALSDPIEGWNGTVPMPAARPSEAEIKELRDWVERDKKNRKVRDAYARGGNMHAGGPEIEAAQQKLREHADQNDPWNAAHIEKVQGDRANLKSALDEMSAITQSFEDAGGKLKDGADAGGQKIEQSGTEFARSVADAASKISQAAAQAAAAFSNIKIPSAPRAEPLKPNANLGSTNAFVRRPTGGGA
jgi:TP901 family phage tail tape measure protein